MEDPVGRWILEIVLLVFCSLLSCAQAALTNANESKFRAEALEDPRAKKLLPLLERPNPALISLRGLRTFIVMLFAVLGAGIFMESKMAFEWVGVLFCLCALPVVMILCQMVPGKLGKKRADQLLPLMRPLIQAVTFLMFPFTWVERMLTRAIVRLFGIDPHAREEEVTEEDIKAMVEIGEESGAIESNESEMIQNVFDFGDMTAADCMTHRTDVTALWVEDDQETILNTIRETGLSRFPVYREDIDDVIGILAARDYFLNMGAKHPRPLPELLREAYFVPETVHTDVLLRNMQRAKTHLAIVVDEYGGMSGLITMEDLLEEIVGNIYDEFDPTAESEIQPLGNDCWRIIGTADLETLEEELDITLPKDEDCDTLGGLIFSRFTEIPEDGATPNLHLICTPDGEKPEEGEADEILIQVEKIEDRRVEWAHITVTRAQKPEEETNENEDRELE
ncbi:MAG: hemolysin family protein [Clostridiales bacterium]|nr:hemolysin family protein [Clostridiales bacterium]